MWVGVWMEVGGGRVHSHGPSFTGHGHASESFPPTLFHLHVVAYYIPPGVPWSYIPFPVYSNQTPE